VVGIAASGSTPYTVEVLRLARAAGAVTIALANNADTPLLEVAQHTILVETGAEALAGSTRLKGGTAQKIVLNVFSTAVMIKLGHTYRGLMVDVQAHNTKLLRRGTSMVAEIIPCSENDAARYLESAQGNVKLAVLIGMGLSREDADAVLGRHAGNLRASIDEIKLDTRS
jgi:N-acetylmuramic acid 6-phosphate etherase